MTLPNEKENTQCVVTVEIADAADQVYLFRSDSDNPSKMKIIVAKNENDDTEKIKTAFVKETCSIKPAESKLKSFIKAML